MGYDNDDTTIAELDLAWRRVVSDTGVGRRGFVTYPHLREWIELDRKSWLGRLAQELHDGYKPKPCQPCVQPKAGAMVRPGAVLNPDDEVIYAFLLGRLHKYLWPALSWSQGDPDIAYQLRPPPESPGDAEAVRWIKTGVKIWTEWREKSLARLTTEISHVVMTDITGYYENIDIARLISDLKSLGAPEEELKLLSACLKRWFVPRGKGIPQGYTASDLLAKVYLNSVDRALKNEKVDHLRYVDDIRVFCGSRNEAKQAIVVLSELMSQRGLNLQSAKTRIHTKGEAKPEIEGVSEKLEDVTQQILKDIKIAAAKGKYVPDSVLFSLLEKKATDTPPPVLEKTFEESFAAGTDQPFNKTLFHFLLPRLAAINSCVAVDYCLHILVDRPEETLYVLRYFGAVGLTINELDVLLGVVESEAIIYDYQLFELVRWFFDQGIACDRMLAASRAWAFDQNRTVWLRSYAVSYLGACGNQSDLEKIEQRYVNVASELEKAQFVAALSGMEIGKRNAFYAKVKSDGDLVARAISAVKGAT